jgi:large subunit ribosomal protein L10
MKTREQKKKELNTLKDKLSRSKIVIFTSFAREGEKGLNVGEMRSLKDNLRAINSEYVVGKKTLIDKVLKENNSGVDVFKYPGSLGVVFGYGEEPAVAKSVYDFAKKNPILKFFSALWNGKFIDSNEIIELAKLPTREILIARFLGMLKYPLSALAGVLNQIAQRQGQEEQASSSNTSQ